MKGRGPYVLIGVLIGIIIIQWGMPVARAQSYSPLNASHFVLRDDQGNVSALLFNGDFGPILSMGTRPAEAQILIGVQTEARRVRIAITGGGIAEEAVEIDIDTHSSSGAREWPRMRIFRGSPIGETGKSETVEMYLLGGGNITMFGESTNLRMRAADGSIGLHVNDGVTPDIQIRRDLIIKAQLPAISGDLDFDQDVDFDDFFLFGDNFGATATKPVAKPMARAAEIATDTWDIAAEVSRMREDLQRQR